MVNLPVELYLDLRLLNADKTMAETHTTVVDNFLVNNNCTRGELTLV